MRISENFECPVRKKRKIETDGGKKLLSSACTERKKKMMDQGSGKRMQSMQGCVHRHLVGANWRPRLLLWQGTGR